MSISLRCSLFNRSLIIIEIKDKTGLTSVTEKDPAYPACKAVRDLQRSVRTSGTAICRYLLCYDNIPAALTP